MLRSAASEGLARLCSLESSAFLSAQIQTCVAYIVGNTDPDGRAGCAQAFADIYRYVGTLAAGPALKMVVDVLLSLCADPHPVVHFWALRSLSTVIYTAGLDYSPFVNSTIVMLVQIYSLDSHEPEGGSSNLTAIKGHLPVYEALCQVIVALSGVFDPDKTGSFSTLSILLALIRQLMAEVDMAVIVAASRSLQQLLIVVPSVVPLHFLVPVLNHQLASDFLPLRSAAINSVYQLVQRDVQIVSTLGGNKFVDSLFSILDEDPLVDGVRQTIDSWMAQTANNNPCAWVDICHRIMHKGKQLKIKSLVQNVNDPMEDEEAVGLGMSELDAPPQSAARWRTQLYALQCLRSLLKLVGGSSVIEHLQPSKAKALALSPRSLLYSRLADLVKIAFLASTAGTMEIRLEGLSLLRQVVEVINSLKIMEFLTLKLL